MPKPSRRFAICIENVGYTASLEAHKIYRVIPDKQAQADGDLPIIDEGGEDYLFPADYFVLVDLPQTVVRVLNKSFAQAPHGRSDPITRLLKRETPSGAFLS